MRNGARTKLLLLAAALGLVSCTTTPAEPSGAEFGDRSRRMEVADPAVPTPAPELDQGIQTQTDSAVVGDGTGRGVFIGPGA